MTRMARTELPTLQYWGGPFVSLAQFAAQIRHTYFILLNAWAAQIPLLGKGGVDAPSRKIPVPMKGADGEAVKKLESSAIPLLASLQGGVAERFRKYREASAYREAGVVFR